jgi:hypothetical protein
MLLDSLIKECGFPDRKRLELAIDDANERYTTREYWDYENARYPSTLHELREPLLRIVELLDTDGNRHTIFQALGGGERSVDRHEELLRDLFRILTILPSSPPARGKRGKPPRQNFHELVTELIAIWEAETNTEFAPYFVEAKPRNRATFFVYKIVEYIDAKRVGSVRKVAEKVVKQRRC